MAYLLGTRRGLEATSSPRGTFAVLALDHRQNLRKELHPEDAGFDDARRDDRLQADRRPGAVGRSRPGRCSIRRSAPPSASPMGRWRGAMGSLVALEATGYDGPSGARISRLLPGLGRRRRRSGWGRRRRSCSSTTTPMRPECRGPGAPGRRSRRRLPGAGPRPVRRAALLRPRWRGRSTGEDRRRVVIATAQRLTALGGDVLKAEFPYDAIGRRSVALGRCLRGARRGLATAVGPPLGRGR